MNPQKQTLGAAESGINIPIKAHAAVACVFILPALSNAGAHKVNFFPQRSELLWVLPSIILYSSSPGFTGQRDVSVEQSEEGKTTSTIFWELCKRVKQFKNPSDFKIHPPSPLHLSHFPLRFICLDWEKAACCRGVQTEINEQGRIQLSAV